MEALGDRRDLGMAMRAEREGCRGFLCLLLEIAGTVGVVRPGTAEEHQVLCLIVQQNFQRLVRICCTSVADELSPGTSGTPLGRSGLMRVMCRSFAETVEWGGSCLWLEDG